MKPMMTSKNFWLAAAGLLVGLSLSACDSSTNPTAALASDASPATADAPAVAQQTAAPLSELESETLDTIELPPPGHFRLKIDGQTFNGKVEGLDGMPAHCEAATEYDEASDSKAFSFTQQFTAQDGRFITIGMSRLLYRDEFWWNRTSGHEIDQVVVTVSPNIRSRLMVRRLEPGSDSHRVGEVGMSNAGPHELPLVRLQRGEYLSATAVGQLYALDEHPDALIGPFEIAVVCP